MLRRVVASCAITLASCGSAVAPAHAPEATPPAPTAPNQAKAASPAPANVPRELPELTREFEAAHVTGTIALFDTQEGVLSCSDVKRCQNAVTPASTFKIPHSMIALETGVVDGPDTMMKWD